ncbi:MAG: hypothetical protein HY716_02255 [Planctomycetes bacterium]|nr:hypothetical protein [Planctomycetota bacterium]
MHIPTVTDQMLEKVLQAAASPVLVEFTEGDSPVGARVHHRIEAIAEEFDDRVIFLRIDCDENPTPAAAWRAVERPCVIIFKRNREFSRCMGNVDRESLARLLERAIMADV